MQDLAALWEMHTEAPADVPTGDDDSESDEDAEQALERSMSHQLAADDRTGSLKGLLRLRWLWLAFWAGAFLRDRFGDVRYSIAALQECHVKLF